MYRTLRLNLISNVVAKEKLLKYKLLNYTFHPNQNGQLHVIAETWKIITVIKIAVWLLSTKGIKKIGGPLYPIKLHFVHNWGFAAHALEYQFKKTLWFTQPVDATRIKEDAFKLPYQFLITSTLWERKWWSCEVFSGVNKVRLLFIYR